MSHKQSWPQPTQSVLVWLLTSLFSTTRSWTPQTVHAILPSKLSMMLSPSLIRFPRSLTATALLSCNFSEITWPSGLHPTTVTQRLPLLVMHQRRLRRQSSQRPRQMSQLPRPPLHLNLRSLNCFGISSSSFFDVVHLLEWLEYTWLAGGVIAAWWLGHRSWYEKQN